MASKRFIEADVYDPSGPNKDRFGDATNDGLGPLIGHVKKLRFAWGGYMEAGYRTPQRVDREISQTVVTIFADKRESPLLKKGMRLVIPFDGEKRIYNIVSDRDWMPVHGFTGTDFGRYQVQAEVVL